MKNIFDINSPVMRFLSFIANLLIANLLFIICCLPVITMGASFTALNKVMQDVLADKGDATVMKPFFQAFRENFKQATISWVAIAVVLAIALWNMLLSATVSVSMAEFAQTMLWLIAIILLAVAMYLFPLLARFPNTLGRHIRNAIILAIANLPRTCLITLLNAIPFLVLYYANSHIVLIFGFCWLIVGSAIGTYFTNWLLRPMFDKFGPEEITENPLND